MTHLLADLALTQSTHFIWQEDTSVVSLKEDNNQLPPLSDVSSMCKDSVPAKLTCSWLQTVLDNKALMVDVLSRILFPTAFIVFNISYWITYWQ